MAKSRAMKQEWIDETQGQVKEAGILLVAHYKGLSVAEITDLRGKVRAAGANFKVTKNLLVKRSNTDCFGCTTGST